MDWEDKPIAPTVLPVATARRSWSWLLSDLGQRRGGAVVAVLVGLAAAGAATVPIYLLGTLIDRVRDGDGAASLVGLAIAIVLSALVGGLGTGLSTYLVNRLGEHTVADLREVVLHNALNLPASTVEEAGRGDLLSRVGTDVATVSKSVSQVLPDMLNALFLGAVTLVGMSTIDWRLGMAGALAVPAYILGLRWYLPRSGPMYAAERVAIAARAQATVESIQGLRTVDAYENHSGHLAEITSRSSAARDISVAVFTVFTRLCGRVNRAEFIGLTAILVVGFLMVRSGQVTVGQTTAAALMFHRLFNPIGMLMYDFDELQSAGASLARLVGVVDLGASAESATPKTAVPGGADIDVSSVSFAYGSGPDVLQGVSLYIPAGTRCALVGTTGAGKSTLASLVAGLLTPTSGRVEIGEVAVGDVDPTVLRRWVATVTQEVHVFSGPLIDDLRLVAPDASRDDVWAAVCRVGAGSWVEALEDGLDTLVGEQGVALSAAQAQHIAMARLVLADPHVVVLDEATAEAGSAHASALDDAARAATAGRTTLVVAHRLTQAADADQIAVMDGGRIVECGTHAQLIALGGRYTRLWRAWSAND